MQEHSEAFEKLSNSHPTAKELLSELVKMVMVVPFSDKVAPAPPPEIQEVEVIEEEPAEKISESTDVSTGTRIFQYSGNLKDFSTICPVFHLCGANFPLGVTGIGVL